jgi:hypothetical protein
LRHDSLLVFRPLIGVAQGAKRLEPGPAQPDEPKLSRVERHPVGLPSCVQLYRGEFMSRDFQIIQLDLDPEAFKRLPNRQRNQLVGCMHAHNELVVLNRLLNVQPQ